MGVTLTWHLILMVIVTVVLIIKMFTEQEGGLDFSTVFYGIILVILWLIYGGIALW